MKQYNISDSSASPSFQDNIFTFWMGGPLLLKPLWDLLSSRN